MSIVALKSLLAQFEAGVVTIKALIEEAESSTAAVSSGDEGDELLLWPASKVMKLTGFSDSQLSRMVDSGDFPPQVCGGGKGGKRWWNPADVRGFVERRRTA